MKSAARLLALILTILTICAPGPASAAVAPRSDAELEADATFIVTGKVADFTVTDAAKGALEISLQVTAVKKGEVKTGDTLRLVTWAVRLMKSPPGFPGPQGLSPLPKKGDTVTAWLTAGAADAKGKTYTPLLPNGVQTVNGAAPAPAPVGRRLQVYIMAGQSNMQGHAQIRTFEHLGMDPATKPLLAAMQKPDGTPYVCERVWISSIGSAESEQTGKLTAGFGADKNKIGPEFTFGLTMEKLVDAPILIIKTAWGGKSLNTDFRPPGAGPYVFNPEQLAGMEKQGKDVAAARAEKEKQTGVYYRLMVEHVKKVLADLPRVVAGYGDFAGYDLAGFVWFQGWNDLVDSSTYPKRGEPGGYAAYSDALTHFIRDVRRDLNAPQLPFVIGVLGVGGPPADFLPGEQRYAATHRNFREAMAAPAQLPEFKGNVAAVMTEKYWDLELTAAKAKDGALREKVKKAAKEEKLTPEAEKAALEKARSEGLTERERLILEKGISNQEFHYLGSAKILGRIGEAFAHAMAELKQIKK